MKREWTESTSRRLTYACWGMTAGCLALASGRILWAFGRWSPPSIPGPWGGILLWAFLALCILFGMDRGIPREGRWGASLLWSRRALLAAAFFATGSVLYVGT